MRCKTEGVDRAHVRDCSTAHGAIHTAAPPATRAWAFEIPTPAEAAAVLAAEPQAACVREQAAGIPEHVAVRANKFAGRCATCGLDVPAEGGRLERPNGKWTVFHLEGDPACDPNLLAETAATRADLVPEGHLAKGRVHVLDGAFHRVHVGQTSGRPYLVRAEVLTPAVRDEDGTLLTPGVVEWELVKGGVFRLSEATLATADEAAAFGQLAGRCCFCSTPIDTPESTLVGYGPHCAAKNGLPLGLDQGDNVMTTNLHPHPFQRLLPEEVTVTGGAPSRDPAYGFVYRIVEALGFELDEVREEVWFDTVHIDEPDERCQVLLRIAAAGRRKAETVGRATLSDHHADARLCIGDPL